MTDMPNSPARSLGLTTGWTSGWTIALCACILTPLPRQGIAQSGDSATVAGLTTLSKVYAESQAAKGRQTFLLTCASCHRTADFAGEKFWSALVGKTVGDFFGYLRSSMPQDNPGSLSDDDYANVTAYILQLNTMPAGERPLPADTTALAKIRVARADTTRKAPTR